MPSQILILDPVVTSRVVMKVRLMEALYDVRATGTHAEALALIAAGMPDLVLLDMGAEAADGMRFCQDLRRRPRTASLPVIALGRFDWPDERLGPRRCARRGPGQGSAGGSAADPDGLASTRASARHALWRLSRDVGR